MSADEGEGTALRLSRPGPIVSVPAMPVVPSYSPPSAPAAPDASFRGVQRVLAGLLPDGAPGGGEPMLELLAAPSEPARLISTVIIEGGAMRARRVDGMPVTGFAAFLDGTQGSRIVRYTANGAPIVHGTVAAVIRDRRNQRLYTWLHRVDRRLYASRRHLPPALWSALEESGVELRDTSEPDEGAAPHEHPFALREAAIHRVQKDREVAEHLLAVEWCRREQRPLFIDGGISGAEAVAHSPCAVGVVKSHRTLYAEGDALATILALRQAERSSVFRVTSPKRATVASWYLRMRDPRGHDPMWGLVRVEIAHPERADEANVGTRADEVSRWILAEAAPLSMPDSRWDKMVYGVRDCEEFLRAVT